MKEDGRDGRRRGKRTGRGRSKWERGKKSRRRRVKGK